MLDKMEARVLQLDQNLVHLKNEQNREIENINQLEFMNLKNNEDFKNVVGVVQTDFNNKLEVKMTDLVNRLLLE